LRSDGYWILSDLLEIPNLMTSSSRKLSEAGKFILGEPLKWGIKDVYLCIYGILSYLGIALFLYYVLFLNPDSILLFPDRIITLFIALKHGDFNVSFVSFFELIIPITLIFFIISSVKSFILFLFWRVFRGNRRNRNIALFF
jgi:putative peptide zinc metalloprotease protein